MKKTIKVAIAQPPSIDMTEAIVSTKGRISATGSSGTFLKPVYPSGLHIALTDGGKAVYELPLSEATSADLLNKLLEYFELLREGVKE